MTYTQTFGTGARSKVLVRGDSRDFKLTLTTPPAAGMLDQPAPRLDLTDALLTFTMKKQRVEGQAVHQDPVTISKSSDDTAEIEILDQLVDETKGQCVIHLQPQDTKFLEPGVFRYDVQLRTASGRIYTVVNDQLFLRDDITSAEEQTPP